MPAGMWNQSASSRSAKRESVYSRAKSTWARAIWRRDISGIVTSRAVGLVSEPGASVAFVKDSAQGLPLPALVGPELAVEQHVGVGVAGQPFGKRVFETLYSH